MMLINEPTNMSLLPVHASEHQIALAHAALAQFPVDAKCVEFICDTDNEVFRVDAIGSAGACKFALRLQWQEDNGPEAVASELRWLEAISAETSLHVPRPVRARDGRPVVEVFDGELDEHRPCVLFEWVDGEFCDDALTAEHLFRVGKTMAQLHEHASNRARELELDPRRVAFTADLSRMLDEGHPLRQGFDRDELACIDAAAVHIDRAITNLGTGASQYGFIHSDLHQWNYLFHEGEVRPIDFCDSGWGHFAYDIAITLGSLKYPLGDLRSYTNEYATLSAAFLKGYSSLRPLPPKLGEIINIYIAARLLFLSELIVTHWANAADAANLRRYVDSLPARLQSLLA
jgi:Ser/Thr protein kinase RdoA (MazF antagonist)